MQLNICHLQKDNAHIKYEMYKFPNQLINFFINYIMQSEGKREAHLVTDTMMWVDCSCFPKPGEELWKNAIDTICQLGSECSKGSEKPLTLATFLFLSSSSCQGTAPLHAPSSFLILVYKSRIPYRKVDSTPAFLRSPCLKNGLNKCILCCL